MSDSADHGLSASEQWLEIEAIKQLKARYFRLMDTKEWLPFSQVFTDDVVVDVSHDKHAPGDTIHGRANVVDFIRKAVGNALTVHHGHMPEIELLSPTEARGIWAMFDYVEFKPLRGIRGYGHYHEEYRKSGGKWHISMLKLTRLRVDPLG
ncbi:MAG: nuclear transport factor 2 family protein [Polyangiales bacterium]